MCIRRDIEKMLFYGRKAEIQNVETDVMVWRYLPERIRAMGGVVGDVG